MARPRKNDPKRDELVVTLAIALADLSAPDQLDRWRETARLARAIGMRREEFVNLFTRVAEGAWDRGW